MGWRGRDGTGPLSEHHGVDGAELGLSDPGTHMMAALMMTSIDDDVFIDHEDR